MVRSIFLKKIVASILTLSAISTFGMISCFAFDCDYVDSDNQTEASTSYESAEEFGSETVYEPSEDVTFDESVDNNASIFISKTVDEPSEEVNGNTSDEFVDDETDIFGLKTFDQIIVGTSKESDEFLLEEFEELGSEGSDEVVIDTTSRGMEYDEDYAKQIMSPEESRDSDTDDSSYTDDNSDLDPFALI